jgi:hypothetical protein
LLSLAQYSLEILEPEHSGFRRFIITPFNKSVLTSMNRIDEEGGDAVDGQAAAPTVLPLLSTLSFCEVECGRSLCNIWDSSSVIDLFDATKVFVF